MGKNPRLNSRLPKLWPSCIHCLSSPLKGNPGFAFLPQIEIVQSELNDLIPHLHKMDLIENRSGTLTIKGNLNCVSHWFSGTQFRLLPESVSPGLPFLSAQINASYSLLQSKIKFSLLCHCWKGQGWGGWPTVPVCPALMRFSVLKPGRSQVNWDQLVTLRGGERGYSVFQTQHGIFIQKPALLR